MILLYNDTDFNIALHTTSSTDERKTYWGMALDVGKDDNCFTTKIIDIESRDIYDILFSRVSDSKIGFKYKTGRFYHNPPREKGKFGYDGKKLILYNPSNEGQKRTCRNLITIVRYNNTKIECPKIMNLIETIDGTVDGIDICIDIYQVTFNNWNNLSYPTYIFISSDDNRNERTIKLDSMLSGPKKDRPSNILRLMKEDLLDGENVYRSKSTPKKTYNKKTR